MALPLAAALAMLAGGTYLDYRNNKKAGDRANAALQRGRQRRDRMQDQKEDSFQSHLDYMQGNVDEGKLEEMQGRATDQFQREVDFGNRTGPAEGTSYGGRESEGAIADKARQAARSLDKASVMAALMGKLKGHTDLRYLEGMDRSRMTGQARGLNQQLKNNQLTTQNTVAEEGRPDPRMAALSSLLQTVGMASAGASLNPASAPGSEAAVTGAKPLANPYAGQTMPYLNPNTPKRM